MKSLIILLSSLSLLCGGTAAAENVNNSFTAGKGTFLYNGEPYVVKAAELHYPRIPRPYWDHRIKMCKALGMNTICLYVFWNFHESEPDNFDFSGQKDLREFIRLCQSNEMNVILRPGPYVCAEWEMGGLPWWLLKDKDIRLRENDPRFMERVDKFQQAVAAQVADLTIDKGGPIIMVQVENEYGSYGKDKVYVAAIRDMLRRYYGDYVTMFQCDWSSNFLDNGLDDLVWTLNFGTGADVDAQFAPLRAERPDSPLMCSEYWSGWFDKWGAEHETRPADEMIAGIDEMLSKGISFSLYMTHGGTSPGHWAGANSPGFAPDVTSYDYDAPINEQGAPTEKYHKLRKMLAKYMNGEKQPPVPRAIPTMSIKPFSLTGVAPLFDNLPEPIVSQHAENMEYYGQGFGSILYSTTLPATDGSSVLTVDEAHDYARVFINGNEVGTLDRRLGEKSLNIPATAQGDRLDILVEAMGRINFGRAIKDFKGITGEVTVSEMRGPHKWVCTLSGWDVRLLPDSEEWYLSCKPEPVDSCAKIGERYPAGVYTGTFYTDRTDDTFLNFENWGKGIVYVNGHSLGRFWETGPQQTLYMPGCLLRKGENKITVFDVIGPHNVSIEGLKKPILDKLRQDTAKDVTLSLEGLTEVVSGKFDTSGGWQQVTFATPAKGRYLVIEALDALDGGNMTAIAELYLLDKQGNRLSRELWKQTSTATSNMKGNHTPDKFFDLQESTYWESRPGLVFPHKVVIDLGAEVEAAGLQYLPRVEKGAPASIGRYRIMM